MGLSIEQIQQRLARFEFQALFHEDMDWPRSHSSLPAAGPTVQVIKAWPVGTVAWQTLMVDLPAADLTIACSQDGQRAFWRWPATQATPTPWRWRVSIKGLTDPIWARRLSRLALTNWEQIGKLAPYLNTSEHPPTPAQIQGFHSSWQALTLALAPLPQNTQRRHYALVLLTRLIALAVLQQRGFLAEDEWYLHNHFGQSQQQGRDCFLRPVPTPLSAGISPTPPGAIRPFPTTDGLLTLHSPWSLSPHAPGSSLGPAIDCR